MKQNWLVSPESAASIGLVRIHYRYRNGAERSVLVKCEHQHPTGTIIDRSVLYILQKARQLGKLAPGDVLTDDSGIDTALALAAVGHAWKYRVRVHVPRQTNSADLALLKSYQAEVILTDGDTIGLTGHYDGLFHYSAFAKACLVEAMERLTGRETGHLCLLHDLRPAALVAGIGSGATLMGTGKYLRTLFPELELRVALTEAQTLETAKVLDPTQIQAAVTVSAVDATRTARLLNDLGLDVGPTSGLNFAAAVKWQQMQALDREVLTVFPDGGPRFRQRLQSLSGKLGPSDLSPGLELLGAELIAKR